jgi:hypothetical protein
MTYASEPPRLRQRHQRRSSGRDSETSFISWVVLAILVLAALFVSVDAARAATYTPPPQHFCVAIGEPPGVFDLSVLPKSPTDRDWVELRYLTHDGQRNPGAWRGTSDNHTPEWAVDLAELGYDVDVVATRDAYCAQDTEIQQRARAVRIAGDMSTPFEPGFWAWGRKSWDVVAWETFLQYNRRALQINLGPSDAGLFEAVVRRQLALAIEACDKGTGIATTNAAGNWQRNKGGSCRPTAWTRAGKPDLGWARPIRIEMPDRELGPVFEPGRLSTGFLSTDTIRR